MKLATRASSISRTGLLLAIAIQLVSLASDSRVDSARFSSVDVDSEELPPNVVPLEYNIEMDFMDNKGTHGRGKVEIIFKMGSPNKSVKSSIWCKMAKKCISNEKNDRLVLHMRHRVFEMPKIEHLVSSDSFESARSGDGQQVNVKELRINEYYRLLVIKMDRSLSEGSFGSIKLSYRISETANELQNLKQNPLVFSQPGEVYRLFPCLDEPHFKSKLTLTVDQPDRNTRIISNMEPQTSAGSELDWERVTFRQTPVAIPLHSLAFAFVPAANANKLFYPIESSLNRMVVVYGSNDQLKKLAFAMEFAAASAEWMERYFNFEHRLPVNLNLIPLPKESSQHSGIENHAGLGFGAINEELMLIDQDLSSVDRKTEAAYQVALVVARQWFGTMLTPRTRADAWITDGLASYMAFRVVRELKPKLEVDQYFDRVTRQQLQSKSVNRNRLRFVRGAQVVDMLRHGAVGGEQEFDTIIRRMFSKQQDVSVEDLAHLFANKNLDKTKLLEIIQSRAKQCEQINAESVSDPWIELAIEGNQLLVEQFHEDNLNLPVAFKIKLSSKDGSKQAVQDVKLDTFNEGNSRVSFKLPSWFNSHSEGTDWLVVSRDVAGELRNFRVRYSDELVGRLRKPLAMGDKMLNAKERAGIIADEVDSLEVADYKGQTELRLAKMLEMFEYEQEAEVLIELLRTIEALNKKASTGNFVWQMAGKYKHWLKDDHKTKASEERLKSTVLQVLARHGDKEVIEWGLGRFRETRYNMRLLGPQTEFIHKLVARAGDWQDRNSLAYWMAEGKSQQEQHKIFKQLQVVD